MAPAGESPCGGPVDLGRTAQRVQTLLLDKASDKQRDRTVLRKPELPANLGFLVVAADRAEDVGVEPVENQARWPPEPYVGERTGGDPADEHDLIGTGEARPSHEAWADLHETAQHRAPTGHRRRS